MKKILAIAAATLLVGTVHAQQSPRMNWGPMYGEIGYSQMKLSDGRPSLNPHMVRGILGVDVMPFLSVEGMAGFGVKDDSVTVPAPFFGATEVTQKIDSLFGLFAKPKYNFGPVEAFARAGWARTRIKTEALGVSDKETRNAFAYGAGVNYNFTPNAYVGVDYMSYFNKDNEKGRGWTVGLGMRF